MHERHLFQFYLKLEKEMGFGYCLLLGELLYAYVMTRPDFGFAITTLAKFAVSPTSCHYQKLKGVAKYLRTTIVWGIIYWRPAPNPALPHIPLEPLVYNSSLPNFPSTSDPLQLIRYVDAAHGNNLRHR
jgi:hypothetical protein